MLEKMVLSLVAIISFGFIAISAVGMPLTVISDGTSPHFFVFLIHAGSVSLHQEWYTTLGAVPVDANKALPLELSGFGNYEYRLTSKTNAKVFSGYHKGPIGLYFDLQYTPDVGFGGFCLGADNCSIHVNKGVATLELYQNHTPTN